jgi:hypothetical protein
MIIRARGTGLEEADVVHALGQVRQNVRHPGTALTVAVKRKGRAHDRTGAAEEDIELLWQPLTVALRELGVGVEQVNAAGVAIHVQPEDRRGPRREVTTPRGQRRCGRRGGRGKKALVLQEAGQGEQTEADTGSGE